MKTHRACQALVIFGLVGLLHAQPQWEDVSPLPGHDVAFLTNMITPEGGLWAAICPVDSGVCYDDRHYRPFLTTDGGDTWEMRGAGIPAGIGTVRIEINPHNPNHLLASTVGFFACPYVSTDRGLTWSSSSEGLPQSGRPQTDCDAGWFPDGVHAWCFLRWHELGRRLYISSDSAVSWDSVRSEGGGNDRVIAVTPPLIPGALLWNSWPGIGATFDYGSSVEWRQMSMPRSEFWELSACGESAGVLYGVAGYWLHGTWDLFAYPVVSTDTGRTCWFMNPSDTLRWQAWEGKLWKDMSRAGHFFFTDNFSLFETWNEGMTWDLILSDTLNCFLTVLGYDPSHDAVFASGSYPEPVTIFERGIWRLDRGESVGQRTAPSSPTPAIQLFPNPFNSSTHFEFTLPSTQRVSLRLYDVLGREVAVMMDEIQTAGKHEMMFDASGLPSGVYLCRLEAGEMSQTRKMVLLK